MNIEELREYLLHKPGATECMPFDNTTLVYKVGNRMFALYGIDNIPLRVNLKCTPEMSLDLRERYESILPGWHMDKKHWNTVVFSEEIDDILIKELIDTSYDLIFQKLTKKIKAEIENISPEK